MRIYITVCVRATLVAVLVGAQIGRLVDPRLLRLVAGVGFVVIGVWLMASR